MLSVAGVQPTNPKLIRASAVSMVIGGAAWIAAEAVELSAGLTAAVLALNAIGFFGLGAGIWSAHFGHVAGTGKAKNASLIGVSLLSVAFFTFSGGSLTLLGAGEVSLDGTGGSAELGGQSWIFAAFLLLMLGSPLFGIAVLKARVYPVWVGLVLLLAPVVSATTAIFGIFSTVFTNLNNAVLAVCFMTMAGYVLSGRAGIDEPTPEAGRPPR